MSHVSYRSILAGVLLIIPGFSAAARATEFASAVVDTYTPGAGISATYQDPSAALGAPNPNTGFGILTPFNAAFAGSDMVGIGQGGELTLQFPTPVPVGPGLTIGVHAGVGIEDDNYPNGQNFNPAITYTNPRESTVSVSSNNVNWVSLGDITFDIPTNYYDQGVTTPGFQAAAGTHIANFSQPFTGTLADFNGEDWTAMLATLNGSAGGTWLDLSGTGLSSVSYIRFDEPNAGETMYVDAVAVANPAAGTSVPLPAAAGMGLLTLILAAVFRLKRKAA